jgi:hypothetical protein
MENSLFTYQSSDSRSNTSGCVAIDVPSFDNPCVPELSWEGETKEALDLKKCLVSVYQQSDHMIDHLLPFIFPLSLSLLCFCLLCFCLLRFFLFVLDTLFLLFPIIKSVVHIFEKRCENFTIFFDVFLSINEVLRYSGFLFFLCDFLLPFIGFALSIVFIRGLRSVFLGAYELCSYLLRWIYCK